MRCGFDGAAELAHVETAFEWWHDEGSAGEFLIGTLLYMFPDFSIYAVADRAFDNGISAHVISKY